LEVRTDEGQVNMSSVISTALKIEVPIRYQIQEELQAATASQEAAANAITQGAESKSVTTHLPSSFY
jgi:hypothetical protein